MHFLKTDEVRYSRAMEKPWAFVKVRFERGASVAKSKLIIEEIMVCKADTLVVDLPERWKVYDQEGKQVKPSKGRKFVVTTETFDPYHAVAEVDG